MPFLSTTSREIPLVLDRSALLFVDVQNYCCRPDGGEYADMSRDEVERTHGGFFRQLSEVALPNMQRLQTACREAGVEVMYTTIESLTLDGRDRSLDYKITGFNVPKGSWDGQVLDAIAPAGDEIVLAKSSSSVFVSTHIDYILRNLGVAQIVICGVLTDQCVESAVRDACDLGYLVTLVPDACATLTEERHSHSLKTIKGYCRQIGTDALIAEIAAAR
ncbi:cysteine hydrolase [Kaustia mangrovi]|uniref:Cysteine hydrolase n=1 Tax=Kaustia mangrovi TaxID=2593653 RepID=A0A7S8C339_9HYPH|nr:isochorismatase family cysteine hydrolase [Kaustia mangrovi]QPC42476.1 cysteine hydrolase [Kaustia mangrovi]